MATSKSKQKAGRPVSKDFGAKLRRIIQLKSVLNPKTGRPLTFGEIGERMKLSYQGAYRYVQVSDLHGRCPECLQKLKAEPKPKAAKPAKQ